MTRKECSLLVGGSLSLLLISAIGIYMFFVLRMTRERAMSAAVSERSLYMAMFSTELSDYHYDTGSWPTDLSDFGHYSPELRVLIREKSIAYRVEGASQGGRAVVYSTLPEFGIRVEILGTRMRIFAVRDGGKEIELSEVRCITQRK
ncbi:MAG TPA: hypothetical protein VMN36_08195 [Verrucomicrobiales bacterium]|nr:hypothetical protein [Verrucomicrobiales bacterium]